MSFDTTEWSLVLAAGGRDAGAAREALERLCGAYWYPLYAYVRRRGVGAEDARDLTQGFFTSLLAGHAFDALSPERGRFRAFLLAALKHYLANEERRRRAEKRGGQVRFVPLDTGDPEQRYAHEPADTSTPDALFERRWAMTVIEHVMQTVRAEWAARGREPEFHALKGTLLGLHPADGYAVVAETMGSTAGAVKVAAHRLRRRFQATLRDTVAATVADPSEIEDELRFLMRALAGRAT